MLKPRQHGIATRDTDGDTVVRYRYLWRDSDMRNALLLIALVVTASTSAAGCMWDFAEFVLKASMQAVE